jgi:DNA-directed RNA polymerase subunit RPC12/RpoP
MFCVSCGVALTDENRQGIACTACRQPLERKRISLVEVNYCSTCGKPFTPEDHAITHRRCRGFHYASDETAGFERVRGLS